MRMFNHGSRSRWFTGGLALALAFSVSACDTEELLEVEDPDTVNPETLNDPALVPIIVAGAKGNFTGTFSGGESYVTVSALMADEFFSAGTFTTRTATDRRDQFTIENGNTSDGIYNGLHFARRALEDAAESVAELVSPDDPDWAELKSLQGYTHVLFGEGFCSSVPVSDVEGGEFVYGPGETSAQHFQRAIALADDALGAGGGNLPAVLKGRALLDLGEFGQAAAAVSGVPTNFNYFIFHSDAGASNGVFSLQGNGRYSISNIEGGVGVPFRDLGAFVNADGETQPGDQRQTWWEDPAGGFDAAYRLYRSFKYDAFSDPVVLASGVEARLIEAEAALQSGGDYLAILNDLRAQVDDILTTWYATYGFEESPSLDPLTDPGTAEGRRDQLFEERAMWLFLTGHRLGDLRRLVYQYGLTEDQAYPSGTYHKGGEFGDDVVFPVDFREANNTEYDISSCDVQAAGIN